MLKISIVEGRKQRRLVVEGKLVAPWAAELTKASEKARADLHDRQLVVDVKNMTAIDRVGENVLLVLMNDGVKLYACGVFTKHALKELARGACRSAQQVNS